jgi:predicted MFS family arabinose efflux permease
LYAAYYGIGGILGNFVVGYFQDAAYKVSQIFMISSGFVLVTFVFALVLLKGDIFDKQNT